MFKFRGFRASLDFITGKQRGQVIQTSSVTSIGGAYRINRGEFGGNDRIYSPPRSIDPSMVRLPHTTPPHQPAKSKSTSDLIQPAAIVEASRSTHDLSQNSRSSKRIAKEQKKLDKQQLEAQKKQEKIAAKERKRQEKLATKNVKQTANVEGARKSVESVKSRKKKIAPGPPTSQLVATRGPGVSQVTQRPQIEQNPTAYSTSTLESSISRSSGPPPYGEYPDIVIDDPASNITFGKPVDTGTWSLVSEHRQQMGRPAPAAPVAPKRKKDLQYQVGNLRIVSDGHTEV